MMHATTNSRWFQAGAAAFALAAWWALFRFGGVTDVGYIATKADPSIFNWLHARWSNDFKLTGYALSFLVPLVALTLAWRRRAALTQGPHKVSGAGFAVILLALGLHVLGGIAQQTRLSLLAMILLLWGIAWCAWGGRTARLLAYPTATLVLAIPLNFFDNLLNPLRVFAAKTVALLASGLGLAVNAAGSLLMEAETRAWTIDLADTTSGIFALFTLLTWSVLLADFRFTSTGRKMLLIAATPVLFWIANTLRGLTVCILAEAISPDLAQSWNKTHPALIMCLWFALAQFILIRLLSVQGAQLRARFHALAQPGNSRSPGRRNDVEYLP
ncbi:MAG TPA: exosortase/archaeosortase family protein [Kiritimatiellia bacterium]|nr:exosortase/archaeosortase family protein [Kiritimatiellia bacterium]